MTPRLELWQLLEHPNPVLSATSVLLSQQIVQLDCSGVLSLSTEQINDLLGSLPNDWTMVDLNVAIDGQTVAPQLAEQLVSWLAEHRPQVCSLGDRPMLHQVPVSQLSDYLEQTQAALRKSEELFQLVFASATVGMALIDLQGCFLNVNQALADMLNQEEAELARQSVETVIHEEDWPQVQALLQQLIAGENSFCRIEVRYITHRQPQKYLHTLIEFTLLCNEQQEPIHLLAQMIDISDRKHTEVILKQSETALRHSQERLNSLLESLDDVIWSATLIPSLHIQYLNCAVEEIYGRDLSEFIDRPNLAVEVAHPDDRPLLEWEKKRLYETGYQDVEYRIIHPDGSVHWVRERARLVYNSLGKPIRIDGITTNITSRKQAEEELRQSEAFLIHMLNAIADPVFVKDHQHRWIMVNDAFCDLTGYAKSKLLGKSDFDFFPNEQAQEFWQTDDQVLSSPSENTNEELLTTRSGETRTIETKKTVFQTPSGDAVIVGTIRDITERKRVEEQLRLMQSAINNAKDVVIITEAEPIRFPGPQIVYVNPAFTHETGYLPQEVFGKTPRILQGEKTDRQQLEQIKKSLQRWEPVQTEVLNYRKDGSQYWVELSIVPISNEEGIYTHWMSVQRNITARKQAEAEILRALAREKELNELKSRFVTMVSHEFRTPLTAIQSSADILQNIACNESDRQELFKQIRIYVNHMVQLLEDVLFIGRDDMVGIQSHPDWFDVIWFGQEIVQELQATIGQHHVMQFQSDRNRHPVYLDPKLLRQILTNLLSNATKYSPEGTSIWLKIHSLEDAILLTIKDEGIGIPQQDLEHLFEFFYRAKNVGTIDGTGLGLAIVKKCVDLLGGSIDVVSGQNQGTTFKVSLPAVGKEVES